MKSQHVPRRRRGFRFHWFRLLIVTLLLAAVIEGAIFLGQRIFLRRTVADWGSIEHRIAVEVLFLRKEKVLTTPFSGRIYPAVKAGSRVRRGTVLAELIHPKIADTITMEDRRFLMKAYSQLAKIETSIRGIDNELTERQNQLAYLRNKNNAEGQIQVEHEIVILRQNKTDLMKEEGVYRQAIAERLNAEWDQHYTCLVADEPGIFWPALDGGESLLDGDSYLPVSSDFHRRYHAYAPILEGKVQEGRAVGKLIMGWEETVVAWVRPETAPFRPKTGERCRLLLPDGTQAELKFTSSSTASKGEFWIFQESAMEPQLLQKRRLKAMLTIEKTAGVRLPKSALWRRNDGYVVLTPDKRRHKELPVTLVDANDQWAVVKGINVGTIVLYR